MSDPTPDPAPLTPLTALIDLELPVSCVPGVTANLALLGEHWRNVDGFAVPEDAA